MSTTTTSDVIRRSCPKCGGSGKIRAFAHIAGGDCFDCSGDGYLVTTVARERRRQSAAARRAAKAEADREARQAARITAFAEAGGTLAEWHAQGCGCGQPGEGCARTWNDGAMGALWDRVVA